MSHLLSETARAAYCVPRCKSFIIIVIIRQPLCPVVGRRPQHVVSKWPCLVLSSAISCHSSICPGRLSTAWLVSLVVFSCHNYGLQVVTREVHRSSLRRVILPAQDHFIFNEPQTSRNAGRVSEAFLGVVYGERWTTVWMPRGTFTYEPLQN